MKIILLFLFLIPQVLAHEEDLHETATLEIFHLLPAIIPKF